jgi:hypothetical protein
MNDDLPAGPDYPTAPNDLVGDYLNARAERDYAQVRLDMIQERLMKQMEADQRKSFRWSVDGVRHVVTYVQSHVTRIDEKGLRRALRAKVFDKYTVRKLDRRAMEAAMDAGVIDKLTVSRFVTLQPNVPHLSYKATPVATDIEETE